MGERGVPPDANLLRRVGVRSSGHQRWAGQRAHPPLQSFPRVTGASRLLEVKVGSRTPPIMVRREGD